MQSKNFSAVVDMRGYFDNGEARKEVIEAAKELVAKDDQMDASCYNAKTILGVDIIHK